MVICLITTSYCHSTNVTSYVVDVNMLTLLYGHEILDILNSIVFLIKTHSRASRAKKDVQHKCVLWRNR